MFLVFWWVWVVLVVTALYSEFLLVFLWKLIHVKTGAAFYLNDVNVSTLKHVQLHMLTCGLPV